MPGLLSGNESCCQKSAERSLPAGDAFTKNLIRKHRQTNVDVDCDVDDDDDSPVVYCVVQAVLGMPASYYCLTYSRRSRLPGCDYFCSGPTRGTRRQSWPPSTSSSANEEANKILMKSWFFVLLMRAALYVFSGEFS